MQTNFLNLNIKMEVFMINEARIKIRLMSQSLKDKTCN